MFGITKSFPPPLVSSLLLVGGSGLPLLAVVRLILIHGADRRKGMEI